MGASGSGVSCAVCGEKGGDMRHSDRYNINVHQQCRGTCPKCKQPKSPEGFVCDGCEAVAKAAGIEVELPQYHDATDLADRARNASKSVVTGKSFPTRIHHRDDM